jgi:hypothetical protein
MTNSSNPFADSQSIPLESSYTNQEAIKFSPETIKFVLYSSCDKLDLIGSYYIGKLGDGAEVSDLMPILQLSNAATNIRLRKLSGDSKVGSLKIPLLCRNRSGSRGSHRYCLNIKAGVTLEVLEAVMVSKGISYEKYIAEVESKLFEVDAVNNAVNEEQEPIEHEQSPKNIADSLQDSFEEELQNNWDSEQEPDEGEYLDMEESDLRVEDSPLSSTEKQEELTTQIRKSNHNTNLLRAVSLDEVLKIIDATTEIVVEQFNKQLAEQDARIVELEKQLALFQNSQPTSINHTEEILHSVRSSVLSKFGERSAKQNGKSPH